MDFLPKLFKKYIWKVKIAKVRDLERSDGYNFLSKGRTDITK